tara:strand:+ start:376 stop:1440 length:1065 start_codon:yes stop_codon:yes gene_type:complete
MPLYLCDLPHDLLRSSMRTASAKDMGHMGRCSRLWLQVCDEVAERRLRVRRPGLPPGSEACPCWLRSIATIEQVEAAVGPKPSRSWHDEYLPLMKAAELAFADPPHVELFEPGGALTLDATLEFDAATIAAAVQAGSSADDAELIQCISGAAVSAILVRAWHAKSTEFAAIMHRVREANFEAAMRGWSACKMHVALYEKLGKGAPTDTIGDHDGLIEFDTAWERLTTSKVGDRIEIVDGVTAIEPIECVFPDDAGIYTAMTHLHDGDEEEPVLWEAQDSDIVCFVPPKPADRGGFHALMHDTPNPTSDFPTDQCMWSVGGPLTVTLEAISEPGEWQVRGLSVRRRLYSVSVSHG